MHYGYMLRGQITGLYKVGISGDFNKRFSQYKTHTPERITMEAVKEFVSREEARDWERITLFVYQDLIEHGEWLNIGFDEAAMIWSTGLNGAEVWPLDGGWCVIAQWIAGGHNNGHSFRMRALLCSKQETADELVRYLSRGMEYLAFNFPRNVETGHIEASKRQKNTEALYSASFGSIERISYLASIDVPESVLRWPADKQLAWCNANLPNGPRNEGP